MRDDEDGLIYLAAGPMAAMVLGVVLIPLRERTTPSNLTFAFLLWTIVVGHLGGRWAAVATALISALSLDFFLTRPYLRLSIESKHDLLAFIGLALCGLVAAALGGRAAPAAAARRQNAALEAALRQLELAGPSPDRLKAIVEALVPAFRLLAASVRDEQGGVIVSIGPDAFSRQTPAVETSAHELAAGRAGPAFAHDSIPEAGLRVAVVDAGRVVGHLDVWGPAGASARVDLRVLAAIARVIGAFLSRPRPAESAAEGGERSLDGPAWTRPGRRASE